MGLLERLLQGVAVTVVDWEGGDEGEEEEEEAAEGEEVHCAGGSFRRCGGGQKGCYLRALIYECWEWG